jgi:hypothetical protein
MDVMSRYQRRFSLFNVALQAGTILPPAFTPQLPGLIDCSFNVQAISSDSFMSQTTSNRNRYKFVAVTNDI